MEAIKRVTFTGARVKEMKYVSPSLSLLYISYQDQVTNDNRFPGSTMAAQQGRPQWAPKPQFPCSPLARQAGLQTQGDCFDSS